jgi:uncharacterized membrane protein
MSKLYKKITLDIPTILTWTIVTYISIIYDVPYVRTVFTIPMVLFIPGYVLIMASFPRKEDLGMTERICLGFGLSIVVVSLLGLFLNYSYGIRLMPILIGLCVYTIIILLIAVYRQRKFSDETDEETDNVANNNSSPKRRMDIMLTMVLIFMSILTIVTIFYTITMPKTGEKFTEFYVLNTDRKADNYPKNLTLNSPTALLTGVTNNEYYRTNYTVDVVIDKDILATEKLVLNQGDTWEKNITFVPDKIGTDMKLELLLFKESDYNNTPYRKLDLWINVSS